LLRVRIMLVVALLILSLLTGIVGALAVNYGIVQDAAGHLGIQVPAIRKSNGDIEAHGHHIRLIGDDGNFEFEHAATTPVARFNSYVEGTPRRTPIAIGFPDGQNLVELIVRSSRTSSDLQQWMVDGRVVSAIDGQGRLRLGNVTLSTAIRTGHVVLIATLPSGKRQIIAR
jgi:hypothetical protein